VKYVHLVTIVSQNHDHHTMITETPVCTEWDDSAWCMHTDQCGVS